MSEISRAQKPNQAVRLAFVSMKLGEVVCRETGAQKGARFWMFSSQSHSIMHNVTGAKAVTQIQTLLGTADAQWSVWFFLPVCSPWCSVIPRADIRVGSFFTCPVLLENRTKAP